MRRIALVSLLCLAVAGTARGEGGWTPLHKAAFAGTVPLIESLLADGASVNTKAENDTTPLHVAREGMAAAEGSVAPYLEAIEILTAHGARSRVPFPFPRESLQ